MIEKNTYSFSFISFAVLTATTLYVKPAYSAEHNYPTSERVEYVVSCIRDRKAPYFELLSKCSCTLDTIAETLDYDTFVSYRTDVFATNIGGERGSVLRDNDGVKSDVKKFKTIELAAQKEMHAKPT